MTTNLPSWTFFAIVGVALQALGIGMFSVVSRSEWSLTGKPVVLVVTAASIISLLWSFLNKRGEASAIPAAATCLAVGYVAAFHIVGDIAFPGLLRDVFAEGYVVAVFHVFGVVLIIYGACAVLVFATQRLRRTRQRSVPSS